MHPFEHLRMVAGATGEDPATLAAEAATALAEVHGDPAALVTACRRLVDRQPACGPLWWVGARVLAAADPRAEAMAVARELAGDSTTSVLVGELPEEAQVVVVGWPPQAVNALRRRGDVEVVVVDAFGEGSALASSLRRSGNTVTLVPESGLGQVVGAGVVLLDAGALGPTGLVATAGSLAAAAVASAVGAPVWAVAGVGRVLPAPLWETLRARVLASEDLGHAYTDIVPARLVDRVVGPAGADPFESALSRGDYPSVPALLRRTPAPGSAVG